MGSGDGVNVSSHDLWEYDQATNIWTQKANFPGTSRGGIGVFFTLSGKAYYGLGAYYVYPNYTTCNDFWMYDPTTNTWTPKATFPGAGRMNLVSFTINDKGYIFGGFRTNPNYFFNELWVYDPIANTWTQKASLGTIGRDNGFAFSLGENGYVGIGRNSNGSYLLDCWEYSPGTDTWQQKADFPGVQRLLPSAFTLGHYGYVGFGSDGPTSYTDFWRYDPVTDSWLQKASLPAAGRNSAAAFVIGGKGYVGTGWGPTYLYDFWEYTPDNSGIEDDLSDNIVVRYLTEQNKIIIDGLSVRKVTIFDLSGKKIRSENYNNINPAYIDVGNISSGTYLIEIISKDKSYSKKLYLDN